MEWHDIVVDPRVRKAIEEALPEPETKFFPVGLMGQTGIRVHVEESVVKRKERAMLLTLTSGIPTCYEGENGELLVISMPKMHSSYSASPFTHYIAEILPKPGESPPKS